MDTTERLDKKRRLNAERNRRYRAKNGATINQRLADRRATPKGKAKRAAEYRRGRDAAAAKLAAALAARLREAIANTEAVLREDCEPAGPGVGD